MTLFPWKRFWCPPTGRVELEGAYLLDPEAEYGRILNPDVVSFEQIERYPCLVLLGEPGIGKTIAVRREIERLEKERAATGDYLRWVELKEYGSEDRLCRDVFESEEWTSWRNGRNRLTLFFDSLDEGLIRVSNLSRLIVRGLRTGFPQRLRLRIACRTAEWPASFQEYLEEFFDKQDVGVYELAPLRQKDIREAALALGMDPDNFLAEVEARRVGPFAAKPVTLRFLLASYQRQGALADSEVGLYEQGCLYLCEEPDQERREAGERDPRFRGYLTPEQRLAAASRVAAVTILGNRAAIYTGDEIFQAPEDDMPIHALVGGRERSNHGPFQIDAYSIKGALKTGLFTSRGASRLGWGHQTYAEYLAARYLKEAPLEQVKSLLSQSDDAGDYVIPQLNETAAWLASLRPDVLKWIMSIQPEVLLRSDVSEVDPPVKKEIVSSLLERFIAGDLLDSGDLRGHYARLAHPRLDAQLEPAIKNRALGIIPRRVAIDIAEACKERSLQHLLADVALDRTEVYQIRVQAAHAVWRMGDEETKKRLKQLTWWLRGEANEDTDDDLRGIALYCLWPRHLSAKQLVACLTPPKRSNYVGWYELFLRDGLAPGIRDADLPQFLNAAAAWPLASRPLSPFGELAESIVKRAWSAIAVPGVKTALAKLFATRIRRDEPIAEGEWGAQFQKELLDDEKRRALLESILNETNITPDDCVALVFPPVAIGAERDTLWLLECIEHAPPTRQPVWARCIALMVRGTSSAAVVDRILELRDRVPALAGEFEWLRGWDLDSELARKAKADYLRSLRWRRRSQPKLLDPPPAERVRRDLDAFEAGKPSGWIQLTQDLTLEPTSSHDNLDFMTDLTDTPGWKVASEGVRLRIISGARSYLLNHAPTDDNWVGTNLIPWAVDAGYRAFRLLMNDVDFIEAIPPDVWERWAATLVGYPGQGHDWHACLACLAYRKAPSKVLACVSALIDSENEQHGEVFCLRAFERCWDERLIAFALECLKKKRLKPKSFFSVGDQLLSHGAGETAAHLAELVPVPASADPENRAVMVESLALLLIHAAEAQWSRIWPVFEREPEVAEEALKRVSQRRHHEGVQFAAELSEEKLGDLYAWMSRRFPPESDPRHEGAHYVGPLEAVTDLRNALLLQLVNRGTMEACKTIERLMHELPDQRSGLTWRLREARVNARRRTWKAPSPGEVIALLQDEQRRYVETESQLQAVIKESLCRLQSRLQGELPAVVDLWSYDGAGSNRTNFRPKDEEDLSDYIARWLRDDLGPARGIIVNREVQPRRGQRTDIYVSAVRQASKHEPLDRLTVVIEVKGCWNDELWTAMEAQLVDRYLRENGFTHGLYVVGWYSCNAWSDEDSRKRKVPDLSMDEVRERLLSEARKISYERPSIFLEACVLDLTFK